jgi:hypothetical protein
MMSYVLTIYAPTIYAVHDVLDAFIYITRANGRGWALELESFLGPVKWHRVDRRVPFGAQNTPFILPLQLGPLSSPPPTPHLPPLPIQNLLEINSYL